MALASSLTEPPCLLAVSHAASALTDHSVAFVVTVNVRSPPVDGKLILVGFTVIFTGSGVGSSFLSLPQPLINSTRIAIPDILTLLIVFITMPVLFNRKEQSTLMTRI